MAIEGALRYCDLMDELPIDAFLPRIVAAVRSGRDVVLEAPPGCGKTTRLPPALLDAGYSVVVLEPRRIAARMAATRVASERGSAVGGEVGFHVRFDRVASRATRLIYVTEGLLTRRLLSDVALEGVDVVVFDEFHERSLHADLGLGLVRLLQATLRPELRIVVMSATLETEALAAELGAEVIRADGRAHPVAIEHWERAPDLPLPRLAAAAVLRDIDANGGRLAGDALVFLPGVGEIRRCEDELRDAATRIGFDVLPLHGDLPLEAQQRAVQRGTRPRVVLATNVAETSLTLEGIERVIDSGYARVLRTDSRSGVDRLLLERISKASATQRAGRAGRLGPGRCLRLYSAVEFSRFEEHLEPEVLRADLAPALLALAAFGAGDPATFPWPTPPAQSALAAARRQLEWLSALDPKGALTPLGRAMAELPVAPRLARMLLEAKARGCGEEGATLAALAAAPNLRPHPRTQGGGRAAATGDSDLLALLEDFRAAQRSHFDRSTCDRLGIDSRAARQVAREAEQLGRFVPRGGAASDPELLRCVLAGFPDRVAKRRAAGGSEALAASGDVVEIDPSSAVRDAPLFVAVDAMRLAGARRVRSRLLSAIDEEWLAEIHPALLRDVVETRFDEGKGRVEGRRRRFFLDLPLRDVGAADPDPVAAAALLARAALHPRFVARLREEGLEDVEARLDLLARSCPELGIGELDDAAVARALERALEGRDSLAGLTAAEVGRALASVAAPQLGERLARFAPTELKLPSGRHARIVYRHGQPPRVAAKLQEFFSQRESPRIAGGRVVVAIDLLAPSGRPVQITSDLASFWSNLYPKERRELMRRYPRHAWPEDPTTASPTSRPLPRR
jgi:ATP-dependent helicase HrpB